MKKHFCVFAFLLSVLTMNAQNMEEILTPRRQGLAVIASFEAKGDVTGLETAIAEALDNGLTISEAKEALSQLYAYTGFPRSLNALGALQHVLEQRKAAGIVDNPGKDADPLPADYDALKQGTEVQTRLTGKPFNYSFVPATDYSTWVFPMKSFEPFRPCWRVKWVPQRRSGSVELWPLYLAGNIFLSRL